MAWFAAALPVQAGKEDEARERGAGFRARLPDYERLNEGAKMKRHLEFLQETPYGATMIILYEFDGDGSQLARAFTDSDYDRWWVGHIKSVHGIDMSSAPPPPPTTTLVHEWKAPGVS